MALITGFFEVVRQQCTAAQIHRLLHKHKQTNEITEDEIRLSGTKEKLVTNLQRVVIGKKLIPISEVYELIQEAEENGHQHIYFFEPKDGFANSCADGAEAADKLFGEDQWGPDIFPSFDRATQALKFADFREKLPGKSKDWMVKLYGHERIFRLKKRKRTNVSASGYHEVRIYRVEDYNTVYVVRWNSHGVLELRIDQAGIEKPGVRERRLQDLWDIIKSAAPKSNFRSWDLRKAITKMLRERETNKANYELGTCRILDARGGAVDFLPLTPDEQIDAEEGRSGAIDKLLSCRGQGAKLVIGWKEAPVEKKKAKPESQSSEPKTGAKARKKSEALRTVLTGDEFNCLVVTSKVSAKVMDYVHNQLRSFAN